MNNLPTYQDLARMVAELVKINIANVNNPDTSWRFVVCFTYGKQMPDH